MPNMEGAGSQYPVVDAPQREPSGSKKIWMTQADSSAPPFEGCWQGWVPLPSSSTLQAETTGKEFFS
jgi:hypothetical protein